MGNYSDLSVLYLEDDALIALEGEFILGELGFRNIFSVPSVNQARQADGAPFDVAILDVNLGPHETSFDYADELYAAGTAIIFLTGYNTVKLPEDFKHLPVLQKPLTSKGLEAAVAEVLGDKNFAVAGKTAASKT